VRCVVVGVAWGSVRPAQEGGELVFTYKKCVTSCARVPQGLKGSFNLIVLVFILYICSILLFLGKTEPRARQPR